MPRFLLATEGPVDELVLSALCVEWRDLAAADIIMKLFPARGIEQVLRLAPDVVPSLAAFHLSLTQIQS